MKALAAIFWSAVACVGVALVMMIVTAVHEKRSQQGLPPSQIPVPAVAPQTSPGA